VNEKPTADLPPSQRAASGSGKTRLDELLVARGLAESRSQAQRLILAGEVRQGDRVLDKPGYQLASDAPITVKRGLQYVSRGGLKLAAALDTFRLDPAGWVCADIGASTGGFTDCLLQRGAARVYAVDVGYGQLAWSLRQNPRVVPIERANIRYLPGLPEAVNLATVDVSFIGLALVLPPVAGLLAPMGQVIALIKPQFEVGKGQVGKGGVVRDPALHRDVLERVLSNALRIGLPPKGLMRSPITGPAGNVEFLAWLYSGTEAPGPGILTAWISDCVG
jgi:23S rRNA (cytidine1920-2'-O)/16S rRNA (cytidine1409-2'-O)-methyltransferase